MRNKFAEQLATKAAENTLRHSEVTSTYEFDIGRQHIKADIDRIDRNPWQPRKRFTEATIQEMALSISSEGLIQPITIRQVGERYQLIAGERRLRAHMHLGMKKIEALVVSATDAQVATLALIENLNREDLTDYEKAAAVIKLQAMVPVRKELAVTLGMARSDLYRYLSYQHLPAYIIQRLEERPELLSRSAASEIVKVLGEVEGEAKDARLLALQAAWTALEAGKLDQTKIAGIISATATPASSDLAKATTARPLLRGAKKIGSINTTGGNLVVKISMKILSKSQTEALEKFVMDLVH